ncbi:hypothetical protein CP973_39085 [Streptomyces albofaciens JCM 4342]|uniref:hypothetical protein n=1 Tax=Streptomyces albofaciens TaxID=66866 RepID=UPI001238B712|nr:hypothetical protein [Streptomyces albofaciens]KAA6215011.1 hypothetical protein CP973_39085 [Streptomyces albofaciens JCM 4342]
MPADLGTRITQIERMLRAVIRSPRLTNASIEGGAVQVYDEHGSLRALVGQQPDGTSGVTVVNGPPPPVPAPPTVAPALAALSVTWDGAFADGAAAPLDFARVEVHVGPDAGFEPSQGTLRDTIETAQGGSVTVPLPYTAWWVKLRARTLAGVAGPASVAIEGTPRKAAAADIQAGAVTAETLAADAITSKHIVGGKIDGALVTGSTVRTGASGNRIVVTPTPPAPLEQIPSVLLHSASDLEKAPGTLRASTKADGTAFPTVELTAPAVQTDWWNLPDTSALQLRSPQLNERDGAFTLTTSTSLDRKQGKATVYGAGSIGPTDRALLRIEVQDGPEAPGNDNGLPARTFIESSGAQLTVRTASTSGDTTVTMDPNGIAVEGWVTRPATDWRLIDLAPGITPGSEAPEVRVTATGTIEMTGYVNLADSTVRSGQQIGTLPDGYRPKTTKRLIVASTANGTIIRMDVNPDGAMRLYPVIGNRATWIGFDSVTCRAN